MTFKECLTKGSVYMTNQTKLSVAWNFQKVCWHSPASQSVFSTHTWTGAAILVHGSSHLSSALFMIGVLPPSAKKPHYYGQILQVSRQSKTEKVKIHTPIYFSLHCQHFRNCNGVKKVSARCDAIWYRQLQCRKWDALKVGCPLVWDGHYNYNWTWDP